MTKKLFKIIFFLIVLACACYGLWPRFILERSNNNVAILADYREITALAKNSGLETDDAIKILVNNGLTGLMISELTGDNIDHGLGQAEFKTARDPINGSEGTIISIMPDSPYKNLLNKWLRLRFAISDDKNSNSPVKIPMSFNVFKTSGIIPDIDGLEAAKRNNLPIYYRPAPSPGYLADKAALMLREVNKLYKLSAFTPAGEIVSGYPDVSALANTAHDLNLPVALVEFSRQIGEPAMNALSSPLLIPLHSVTNEEMTARKISRSALRERLLRAAVERSVRFLLLRTAPPNSSEFTFEDFSQEVKSLADTLKSYGFKLAWPEPVFANVKLNTNIFAAFALSGVLFFALYSYLIRMGLANNKRNFAVFIILGVITAGAIYKFSGIARLAGAFCAPLIAVEASLIAMDSNRDKNLIPAFLFAVISGLALASFFSVTSYMLRLQTFSGVKLTLVLPPVLVLLHDFKKRIHPESILEFLSRPPLWGELVLIGVLLAAVGLMLFRSGNVAFIPGFEAKIRAALERVLIARPRTREVFVGYPSLLLLNFLVSKNLFAHYREIFRVGVVLGFSTVINSFCHFHTPLSLILLREFNGLWTGLLAGLAVVLAVKFVIMPLLKLIRPLIS